MNIIGRIIKRVLRRVENRVTAPLVKWMTNAFFVVLFSTTSVIVLNFKTILEKIISIIHGM